MTDTKPKRIRLTAREISAILSVAGDALAEETLRNDPDQDEKEYERNLAAFESGMEKLRVMLGRKKWAE